MHYNKLSRIFSWGDAYIAYLPAGFPDMRYTEEAAVMLLEHAGVDVLEIGVPFSDAIADGPVIQNAMHEAIANGVDLADILACIKRIKSRLTRNQPIMLFSYYNPLLQRPQLGQRFAKSGVDGLLVVDLPLEASSELASHCLDQQVPLVCVASPSTAPERIHMLTRMGGGFLYYACRQGITGMRSHLPLTIQREIRTVKQHSRLPVAVGFGISDSQQAAAVLQEADGFVVGSKLVSVMAQGVDPTALARTAMQLDPRGMMVSN